MCLNWALNKALGSSGRRIRLIVPSVWTSPRPETAIALARNQEHPDARSVLFQRFDALGGGDEKALSRIIA
jgi:hypothetical protein